MPKLSFVPRPEFQRVLDGVADPLLRCAAFAQLCRINTLYMVARAGSGHLGSSFSSLEIVSLVYLNRLRRQEGKLVDTYFSSKGHDVPGLYAVLTGLGMLEFDLLHRLRRLEGLPGHPDRRTPGIVTNTGSLGMGVSKAKGMALARRLSGREGHIYLLTGDGELQEGQFWESLPSAVNQGLSEITVVVDHNKLQSDTLVEAVNPLGELEAKFATFGFRVQRVDGHDLMALNLALPHPGKDRGRPVVVIADTVKGKGVSFMEGSQLSNGDELYRYHSGAPSPEEYQQALDELQTRADELLAQAGLAPLALESLPRPAAPPAPQNPQRLVEGYGRELLRQAERNPRLVALDADLLLDCGLVEFKRRFPQRLVECGIAEQDMVSQAGGLALEGLLPVVHSFACFLSARANEQIYNNASEGTKIVYVGSLAGLLPGAPGHSHQAVRDISALAAVPGLVLFQPCDEKETALGLDYCLNQLEQSIYFRLTTIPVEVPYLLPVDYRPRVGRGVVLRSGSDAALVAYGPVMLNQAWQAAEELARQGIQLRIINLPWLNRLDLDWLLETLKGCRRLFTLDDHYLTGGQGEMIAARLAEAGGALPVTRFGVGRLPACGQNHEVLKAHGLDAAGLARRMAEALGAG